MLKICTILFLFEEELSRGSIVLPSDEPELFSLTSSSVLLLLLFSARVSGDSASRLESRWMIRRALRSGGEQAFVDATEHFDCDDISPTMWSGQIRHRSAKILAMHRRIAGEARRYRISNRAAFMHT
jgi:hypothetical protein